MHGLAASFHVSMPGEGIPAFGVVLTILAVLGVAAAWRRRSAWLLALLWLGGALLALGPTLHIGSRDYVPLSQTWQGGAGGPPVASSLLGRVPGVSWSLG